MGLPLRTNKRPHHLLESRAPYGRPGKGSFREPESVYPPSSEGNELPLSEQGNRRSRETPHLLLTPNRRNCPPTHAVKLHARARCIARFRNDCSSQSIGVVIAPLLSCGFRRSRIVSAGCVGLLRWYSRLLRVRPERGA